jgi:hypothetical protein
VTAVVVDDDDNHAATKTDGANLMVNTFSRLDLFAVIYSTRSMVLAVGRKSVNQCQATLYSTELY